VDVRKEGVDVFKFILDNLYPKAFCVISQDPYDSSMAIVSHADSAGSKPIVSYLAWRETDDPTWFKGLAQDVLAMNINDLVCVAAEPLVFVDYIAYNTMLINRVQLLSALAKGFKESFNTLAKNGMRVLFGGGETADLPDQMRTLDVCGALFGRVELRKIITGENIVPGDLILGLRSGGPLNYESYENSGLMCNGLTLARNCLLERGYLDKYPEAANPDRTRHFGRFKLDDYIEEIGMTIGEALTSPTRMFAPIAIDVLKEVDDLVHGMVHNTGGGQTKCIRLGNGIRYVKDSLPNPDPIFSLIQDEANVDWREMYEDFNMGVGFEFIIDPEATEKILGVADRYGIGVQIVGRCERSKTKNDLIIKTSYGKFFYN
jgi:phosphoribosylformylglycinamidine cyclo-ligase